MDEGYSFDSLSLDTLTIPNGRFLPADLSRAEGSKWFSLEELLLDTRRIKDDLKSTADNIKRHPILIAENEAAEQRKKSIDLLFDDDFF